MQIIVILKYQKLRFEKLDFKFRYPNFHFSRKLKCIINKTAIKQAVSLIENVYPGQVVINIQKWFGIVNSRTNPLQRRDIWVH